MSSFRREEEQQWPDHQAVHVREERKKTVKHGPGLYDKLQDSTFEKREIDLGASPI